MLHLCDLNWKVHSKACFPCDVADKATLRSIIAKFEEGGNILIREANPIRATHSRDYQEDVSDKKYPRVKMTTVVESHIYLLGMHALFSSQTCFLMT